MIENDSNQKKINSKFEYFHTDKNKNRHLDLTKKSTHASTNHNYENNITLNSNNYYEENKFKLQYDIAKKEDLNKSEKRNTTLKVIVERKKHKNNTNEDYAEFTIFNKTDIINQIYEYRTPYKLSNTLDHLQDEGNDFILKIDKQIN